MLRSMILWLIALVLLASLAVVGYYQGAVRVAFSLVGLLVAALVAVPLSGLIRPILPPFGITHPVVIAFLAPAIVYVLVLVIFKSSALLVHKKLETWMKYHASDTQRLLYERMISRVGICLGVANAFVYLVLISVVAYTLGYFTMQVSTPGQDGFGLRMLNSYNEALDRTGMVRAAAHYSPATGFYCDACDLIGDIFHNPLLQGRLSSYPPFLTLSEKSEFSALAGVEFQRFWQGEKTLAQIREHPQLGPMIQDVELYNSLLAMNDGDLKDLTTYFETGVSPKYEEDKILGRWRFDFRQSYNATKRSKPTAGVNEIMRIRKFLEALRNTTFLATVDHKAELKLALPQATTTVQGTWKNNGGGMFGLRMQDSGKSIDVEARVQGRRLSFSWIGFSFVLERVAR